MILKRALFCLLVLGLAGSASAQEAPAEAPRNVILLIADGAGPASFTMARDYLRQKQGAGAALALDSLLVGALRTYATSSRVTDSAAGATAFSAGVKTYNGAIAVDPQRRPVATLLEAAEERGMATGLIATSRLTHATPAAFAAHVPSRAMEDEIAAQMMKKNIEVLMGGGRRHFLPEAVEAPVAEQAPSVEQGHRTDGRNLINEARAAGYTVAQTRDELMQVQETPLLCLFQKDHMSYDLDRDAAQEPSLAEMTRKTLDLLAEDEDGFFLMVEGSRIDHAGHNNDAAAHLRELLAYNEAAEVALDFARRDGQTLVLSTSDHETGGLTLGRNREGSGVYAWHPDVLARVQASHGAIITAIRENPARAGSIVRELAGLDSLSAEEQALLDDALRPQNGKTVVNAGRLNYALSEIIGRRALAGWTTTGHTAVDVNLYAYGPGRERFIGNRDNTYIGQALAELLGFDLEALTEALRKEGVANVSPAGQ